MTDHTPFPWTLTANSWQHTSIYDAGGHVVCRLDLEDWGVTEDSQDRLEKLQAETAAYIVDAANNYASLHKAVAAYFEYLRKSINVGPLTKNPTREAALLRRMQELISAPAMAVSSKEPL